MAIVIAQRQRIEEQTRSDPAQGASHDDGENIGEDAIEAGPSADPVSDVSRITGKTGTVDYSASALFFFFSFSQRATPVSGAADCGGLY